MRCLSPRTWVTALYFEDMGANFGLTVTKHSLDSARADTGIEHTMICVFLRGREVVAKSPTRDMFAVFQPLGYPQKEFTISQMLPFQSV